jgi:hypothetical protein
LYSSLILLLLIVPSAIYFIVNTSSIFTRSLKIFSLNNFNIIVTAWNHVNTDIDLYENIHLTVGDYDMSWWMRIHKWCYALKIYVTHPECYLQGIGPGACSAALDGSFLRILAENGIIGVLLYYKLFRYIYDQTETLKWIMLAFALNMIFFDIYLAYKPMSLLFLLTGFYYQSSQLQVKPSHQAVLA